MGQEQASTQPFNRSQDASAHSLEQVITQLRSVNDPHVRDIGERWSEISPDDIRLYERYTMLWARFEKRNTEPLDDQFWVEVQRLTEQVQKRQHATRSEKADSPTAIFIAMIATKVGGLDGYRQLTEYKRKKGISEAESPRI